MKKNKYTHTGLIAMNVFLVLAATCVMLAIDALFSSEILTPAGKWGYAQMLINFAFACCGMAWVAAYHLHDQIDKITATAVNALFGAGMLFGLFGSYSAVRTLPASYSTGQIIVMAIGFGFAVLAPLLHSRLAQRASVIIDDSAEKQKRPRISTAAILSLIYFGTVASTIIFQLIMWFHFT